jgi:hypothetical protein
MPFLIQDDITDKVASRFKTDANTDLDYYLDLGDQYIVSLAQSKGVLDSTDIATPMVIELKQYGLCKVYIELFGDVANVNNNEAFEIDKYQNKVNYYMEKAKYYANQLTKEMILQEVEDITDRHSGSFELFRS